MEVTIRVDKFSTVGRPPHFVLEVNKFFEFELPVARWEATAAASIPDSKVTPNLLNMVKLEVRDPHLWHHRKTSEAIVRLDHSDIHHCR